MYGEVFTCTVGGDTWVNTRSGCQASLCSSSQRSSTNNTQMKLGKQVMTRGMVLTSASTKTGAYTVNRSVNQSVSQSISQLKSVSQTVIQSKESKGAREKTPQQAESMIRKHYPRALSLVSARIMKLSESRQQALKCGARRRKGVAIHRTSSQCVLMFPVFVFSFCFCRALLVSFVAGIFSHVGVAMRVECWCSESKGCVG